MKSRYPGLGPRLEAGTWARAALALLLAVSSSLSPARANADWLAGSSRAISITDSASPDAPVTSYAYGPRAQGSLGGDLALYRMHTPALTFRLGGSALVAFEDATRRAVLPGETMRTAFELSAAWELRKYAAHTLGDGKTFELTLALGRHSALPMTHFTLGDRYHANDVPFGAGGNYLSADLALRTRLAFWLTQSSRLGFRAFSNAFPNLVGAHEASDHVADGLHEGAQYQAWFELGLRWHATDWAQPIARWYFDAIAPHDDSAKPLVLARFLFGVALPGTSFELTPYNAVEAGHGQGILVNRTELRWSFGVRLSAHSLGVRSPSIRARADAR